MKLTRIEVTFGTDNINHILTREHRYERRSIRITLFDNRPGYREITTQLLYFDLAGRGRHVFAISNHQFR